MTHGLVDPESVVARPLITLALYCYNQETFIRNALAAAFAQTYEPLEIIVSDDCSDDSSFQLIREICASYEGRHRVIVHRTERNLGKICFGKRIEEVLRISRGELIVMAAGDDVSVAERCEELFSAWDTAGRAKISLHSSVQVVDHFGNVCGPPAGENEIASRSLAEYIAADGRGLLGASHAFSRALVDEFPPLPDKLLLEDGAIAFRARLRDGIVFVNKPLVMYRRHDENITNGRELRSKDNFDIYISALLGLHSSFFSDYVQSCKIAEAAVLLAMERKLNSISKLKLLFEGNIFQRLRATLIYSGKAPIKRRIWLVLRCLGVVGPEAARPRGNSAR
jgi:glycosyltransferase involved in cell wall biosynthesis